MDYADIVWSGAPFSLLAKLDQIVVEAMRLIKGAPARSNIDNLYKETAWPLLSKRHEIHSLKMMYKTRKMFLLTKTKRPKKVKCNII